MPQSNTRTDETTHVVSYWVVPGGSSYDLAWVKSVFFDNESEAQAFADARAYPPDMAICSTIATYDQCVSRSKQHANLS